MRLSISIVMVVILLCISVPFAAIFASETVGEPCLTIEAPEENITPGEKFDVEIGIKDNPGIIALNFKIVYNSDLIELVGYEDMGLLNGFFEPSPRISSPYTFRWSDKFSVVNNGADGIVLKVSFILKRNIEKADENNISVVFNSATMSDLTYAPNYLRSVSFESAKTEISTNQPASLKMKLSESELPVGSEFSAVIEAEKECRFDRLEFRLEYPSDALEIVNVIGIDPLDSLSFGEGSGYADILLICGRNGADKTDGAVCKAVKITFKEKKAPEGANSSISVSDAFGYLEEEILRKEDKPIAVGVRYRLLGCSEGFKVLKPLYGDSDKNGIVDEGDAVLIAKWLVGWDVEIESDLADIDRDGCVTDWDAVLLARYLAGWESALFASAD